MNNHAMVDLASSIFVVIGLWLLWILPMLNAILKDEFKKRGIKW